MKKILMVCLGNICRSPLAEALLRSKVSPDKVVVDSAGLDDWHAGEPPCKTSQEVAKANGLDISMLRARAFTPEDFDTFDLIYVMDDMNYKLIQKRILSRDDFHKVDMIMNEVFPNENISVPDSYQKGKSAAAMVYKMLDAATDQIAKKLKDE